MHTIHVILLENYVLFILVFYIVIYLIIPVVIIVLKCIVLISTVLFKLSLLYPEKDLIIENKICHCHCHCHHTIMLAKLDNIISICMC